MRKRPFQVFAASVCLLTATFAQEKAEPESVPGTSNTLSDSQSPQQYPVIDMVAFEAQRLKYRAIFQQTWQRQADRERRERTEKVNIARKCNNEDAEIAIAVKPQPKRSTQ